ncbi:MAG: hypothetical protein ACRDMX_13745 [Solirubrobacteraceae bacterium]
MALIGPWRLALAGTLVIAVLLALAAGARAGSWVQVSCVNPDGSAAPAEGWIGSASQETNGDSNSISCGPGLPLTAELSSMAPDTVNAYELLAYTPPTGSTLDGGTIDVALGADGSGPGASAVAAVYEPRFVYDGDVFFQCANGQPNPCGGGSSTPDDFSGQLTVPADRGGNFYIAASCGGQPGNGDECNTTAAGKNDWSIAQLYWARFLLSTQASPTGSGFSGSALTPATPGTSHLVFTGTDPGGPGVYRVTASIDGTAVWSATPNTNNGWCVPAGTDSSGALMFDHQQPCPATESVDVPISTAGISPGSHELAVSVTDAAGDTSTVLDQTITVLASPAQTTPAPPRLASLHARFVIKWSWRGRFTRLRSIAVHRLARHATVSVRCRGRHCPRLRPRRESARHIRTLLRHLRGRRFYAGDHLWITVSERGHRSERILLVFRDRRRPSARLLR